MHGFLLSCLASVRLRESIDVHELSLALVGLVAGTVTAALFLVWLPSEQLPRLLGFFILVAVALSVAGYLASPWLSQLVSPRVIRACLLSITAISGAVLVFKG